MNLSSVAAACTFAALAAGLATPAAAQSSESPYAELGRWTVYAVWKAPSQLAYCGATVRNGKADLRVATDGRTWEIGTRHRGQSGVVNAYYGFGVAGETTNLQVDGSGWASMSIDRDQLQAFRTQPEFSLNIGKNEQTWKLAGAAAAIDEALECARKRGMAKIGSSAPQPVGVPRPFGPGFDGWDFTATTYQAGVTCRAIRRVGGRDDIMAMTTSQDGYFSVSAEGRRGKWDGMYVMVPGPKKREWRMHSEANGLRLWFTMPDVRTAAEIAAAGQYQFSVPDDEYTETVPLGKRATEALERVKQCIKANGL